MGLSDDIQQIEKERRVARMYDNLCSALEKEQKKVEWYALGEAKRLAQAIRIVCNRHQDKKDEESCQKLVLVAEKTLAFLRRMGSYSSPEIVETQRALDHIKMET